MNIRNMNTQRTMDKTEWVSGPWTDEPDICQWIYEGIDCLIVRNRTGALCGYAGVPETHKAFGVDYEDVYSSYDINIHGGLTFAGEHKRKEIQSKANNPVWWLGFDCAHLYDLMPHAGRLISGDDDIYRDISYVAKEVERLVDQLMSESNDK